MTLKSLADSDANAFEREAIGLPVPNGIACPKCGFELMDTHPNQILTSHPPQKTIGCVNIECGYTGMRYI